MMHDIDPMDIDPETNRPYANYSSPSLDTSFHDHEMAGEEPDGEDALEDVARVLFDQRQTEHDFDDAEEADPLSDAGTLRSICFDDAAAVLRVLKDRAGG